MGNILRLIRSVALVGMGGALIWRTAFFNPSCQRTPMGEISGNPLLKELLVPSVFLIRAVSILDHTLEAFITARGLQVPGQYRKGAAVYLDGRIRFLADAGFIANDAALHAIRQRRNDLAHDPAAEIGWDVFEADAAEIIAALQALGLKSEADIITKFRHLAQMLKVPEHKKRYLNNRNLIPTIVADGIAELLGGNLVYRGLSGGLCCLASSEQGRSL